MQEVKIPVVFAVPEILPKKSYRMHPPPCKSIAFWFSVAVFYIYNSPRKIEGEICSLRLYIQYAFSTSSSSVFEKRSRVSIIFLCSFAYTSKSRILLAKRRLSYVLAFPLRQSLVPLRHSSWPFQWTLTRFLPLPSSSSRWCSKISPSIYLPKVTFSASQRRFFLQITHTFHLWSYAQSLHFLRFSATLLRRLETSQMMFLFLLLLFVFVTRCLPSLPSLFLVFPLSWAFCVVFSTCAPWEMSWELFYLHFSTIFTEY